MARKGISEAQRLDAASNVQEPLHVPDVSKALFITTRALFQTRRLFSIASMLKEHASLPALPEVQTVLEKASELVKVETQQREVRRGRPRSPRVNGDRLRKLREEAGLSRQALINALKRHTKREGAFHMSSLQNYESSKPA